MWHASEGGKDLLRFITCGSVDDGKSTLIGRFLFDSGLLSDDQLAELKRDSRNRHTGAEGLDFSLLVDGLMAEREQGITIDVAYRFFETAARRYIVADTPGHEQYTRNMATAASRAELALLLADARKGLLQQTRRHARIAALMGIRHVILAVNKMDLIDYNADIFGSIAAEFTALASTLEFMDIQIIPVSALNGDNVLFRSTKTPWFSGAILRDALDTVQIGGAISGPFRMPVQYVVRSGTDFRGYAGLVTGGGISVGDDIVISPSRRHSRVNRIVAFEGDLKTASMGQSVVICLADNIDVSRGDVFAADESAPLVADQFAAELIWMDEEPLYPGRSYVLRIGTSNANASATEISNIIDLEKQAPVRARQMRLNDIGHVKIATDRLMAFDAYRANRDTGSFILIDRLSNRTVAAGMVVHPLRRGQNIQVQKFDIDHVVRAELKGQKPAVVWLTGLSGAGKSTIANIVERKLTLAGRHCYIIDGDNIRHGVNKDLGFTAADRVENMRRVAEIARLLADAGLIVIVSLISPFVRERAMAREIIGEMDFLEVFVDAPLAVCEARDPKHLYAKARTGAIVNFTGIDAPYEPPPEPDLVLHTADNSPDALAEHLIAQLLQRGIIPQR
ncbi:MAG TPA: adenylyl-sulfate kinase [Xanthobacteraceae bacterium]|nr:adenylyl-sulfate kinase [Xanthobacteraceae bacterium]